MSPFDKVETVYADVLTALHGQCFEKAWDKSAFESLLSLPTTYGFLNENAFILCSVCADEAEILTLGVIPKARKQGIALTLLTHTCAALKDLGVVRLFLDVDEKNSAARGLYEKAGFCQVGVRRNYYTHENGKSDALLLQKKL